MWPHYLRWPDRRSDAFPLARNVHPKSNGRDDLPEIAAADLARRTRRIGEKVFARDAAQAAHVRRGRPPGSVKAEPKVSTTIRLDGAALARWRASGKGWQSRAAKVLAVHAPK